MGLVDSVVLYFHIFSPRSPLPSESRADCMDDTMTISSARLGVELFGHVRVWGILGPLCKELPKNSEGPPEELPHEFVP